MPTEPVMPYVPPDNEDLRRGDSAWQDNDYDRAVACYQQARSSANPDHQRIAANRLADIEWDFKPVWSSSTSLYHKDGCPAWNPTYARNYVRWASWRAAEKHGKRPHVNPRCNPQLPERQRCPGQRRCG